MSEEIKLKVVDELDRLRYSLAGEKVKRIEAEMRSLQLQLAQLNQTYLAAVAEFKQLNKRIAEKYGLSEGDSFSVATGEIREIQPK